MSNSRDTVCVLVVAHKNFDKSIVPDKGYRVIKVGNNSDFDNSQFGGLCDSTGDNISSQNPYYCELTALYWAWKNLDVPIIGLCHYRRYFANRSGVLNEDDIVNYLTENDVILSYPLCKSITSRYSEKKPLIDQQKDLGVIQEILKRKYPNEVQAFNKLVYGKGKMIWHNAFITHKDIFCDYCSFLFDVMEEYDLEMKKRSFEILPRYNGYLAEWLLPTWFLTHYSTKIKYMEFISTSDIEAKGVRRLFVRNGHLYYNATYNFKEYLGRIKRKIFLRG